MSLDLLVDGLWSNEGLKWPAWTPPDLAEWLARLMHSYLPFDPVAVTDPRMKEVWEWHQTHVWHPRMNDGVYGSDLGRTSLAFCTAITRARVMPKKPGNFTPKAREDYMRKIRAHAEALIELLEGTRFDAYGIGQRVPDENLSSRFQLWGDEDDGHLVAFWVDDEGVHDMPWDFPECALREHLFDLVQWTQSTDYFDRSISRSSSPIVHANASNIGAIYFTCTLYNALARCGVAIPFPHLATIANVALRLGPDEMLDEDAVRKQVRRFQARKKAADAQDDSPIPF